MRIPRLVAIPGTLPEPSRRPPGCRFAPRCTHALPSCSLSIPVLETLEPTHTAACFRAKELAPA